MKSLISFDRAGQFATVLFGIFIAFHLSIIIGIVMFDFAPIDYLWGGRMKTSEDLLGFEIVSLLIMGLCLLVVLIRSGGIKSPRLIGFSRIVLWVLFALFLLNTVGNLLAKTNFEKGFAVVTALLSFFTLRLALEKIQK